MAVVEGQVVEATPGGVADGWRPVWTFRFPHGEGHAVIDALDGAVWSLDVRAEPRAAVARLVFAVLLVLFAAFAGSQLIDLLRGAVSVVLLGGLAHVSRLAALGLAVLVPMWFIYEFGTRLGRFRLEAFGEPIRRVLTGRLSLPADGSLRDLIRMAALLALGGGLVHVATFFERKVAVVPAHGGIALAAATASVLVSAAAWRWSRASSLTPQRAPVPEPPSSALQPLVGATLLAIQYGVVVQLLWHEYAALRDVLRILGMQEPWLPEWRTTLISMAVIAAVVRSQLDLGSRVTVALALGATFVVQVKVGAVAGVATGFVVVLLSSKLSQGLRWRDAALYGVGFSAGAAGGRLLGSVVGMMLVGGSGVALGSILGEEAFGVGVLLAARRWSATPEPSAQRRAAAASPAMRPPEGQGRVVYVGRRLVAAGLLAAAVGWLAAPSDRTIWRDAPKRAERMETVTVVAKDGSFELAAPAPLTVTEVDDAVRGYEAKNAPFHFSMHEGEAGGVRFGVFVWTPADDAGFVSPKGALQELSGRFRARFELGSHGGPPPFLLGIGPRWETRSVSVVEERWVGLFYAAVGAGFGGQMAPGERELFTMTRVKRDGELEPLVGEATFDRFVSEHLLRYYESMRTVWEQDGRPGYALKPRTSKDEAETERVRGEHEAGAAHRRASPCLVACGDAHTRESARKCDDVKPSARRDCLARRRAPYEECKRQCRELAEGLSAEEMQAAFPALVQRAFGTGEGDDAPDGSEPPMDACLRGSAAMRTADPDAVWLVHVLPEVPCSMRAVDLRSPARCFEYPCETDAPPSTSWRGLHPRSGGIIEWQAGREKAVSEVVLAAGAPVARRALPIVACSERRFSFAGLQPDAGRGVFRCGDSLLDDRAVPLANGLLGTSAFAGYDDAVVVRPARGAYVVSRANEERPLAASPAYLTVRVLRDSLVGVNVNSDSGEVSAARLHFDGRKEAMGYAHVPAALAQKRFVWSAVDRRLNLWYATVRQDNIRVLRLPPDGSPAEEAYRAKTKKSASVRLLTSF